MCNSEGILLITARHSYVLQDRQQYYPVPSLAGQGDIHIFEIVNLPVWFMIHVLCRPIGVHGSGTPREQGSQLERLDRLAELWTQRLY
jgi:hypothetical protein